jgi:hypothetical protein
MADGPQDNLIRLPEVRAGGHPEHRLRCFAVFRTMENMIQNEPDAAKTRLPGPARPHPARLEPAVLDALCEFRATRRSGPGGQNRNKVETAVILTHKESGVSAEASEQRTQAANRSSALFRLRLKLALEIRQAAGSREPPAYQPSELWRQRLRAGRIVVNPKHNDFPALLAEALDVLAENDYEPAASARALCCSPSQLIKLLRDEPRALALVNEYRRQSRLHPLH